MQIERIGSARFAFGLTWAFQVHSVAEDLTAAGGVDW